MAQAPLVPPLALLLTAACVAGAAALANCALLATTLKRCRTGSYNIISQIAILDCILLATTVGPELWTYNSGTWSFGQKGCVAYRGLSVLATTASVYLVATLALHSLAEVNLEEKAASKRKKQIDREDDDEIRSSRHSLVATSDSSTPPRTMNIDYRMPEYRVPVILPLVFVWILSGSLSVPEFTLATTVEKDEALVCSTIESSHRLNMQMLLAVFTLVLPTAILVVVGFLTLWKLKCVKRILDLESESVGSLKLSAWLIGVYCAMCVPRTVVDIYSTHLLTVSNSDKTVAMQMDNSNVVVLSLVVSCIYLLSILLRPLLSLCLLDPLRKMLSCHSDVNV